MDDHKNDPKSHGVEILDRANTIKKLELKEMLYIRKFNQTLNKQLESEPFTLIQ